MTPIDILAGEQGTTRVFSLSMTASEARQLRDDPKAQIALLGAARLNTTGIEVFAVSDLSELGLVGYLREGVDAAEADLARDRTKLSALDGWVLLLHSLAFGGLPMRLEPVPALTLIGTYGQAQAPKTKIKLEAEAAKPYTGSPDIRAGTAASRAVRGAGVFVGLVLLLGGLLWWALS